MRLRQSLWGILTILLICEVWQKWGMFTLRWGSNHLPHTLISPVCEGAFLDLRAWFLSWLNATKNKIECKMFLLFVGKNDGEHFRTEK